MSVKGKKKESAEQVCVKFWWFFICASFSLLIQLNPRAQNVFRPWRELYRRYKSCTNLFQWNRFGACTKTRWPVPLEKEIENNTCSLFHPVPPCSTLFHPKWKETCSCSRNRSYTKDGALEQVVQPFEWNYKAVQSCLIQHNALRFMFAQIRTRKLLSYLHLFKETQRDDDDCFYYFQK